MMLMMFVVMMIRFAVADRGEVVGGAVAGVGDVGGVVGSGGGGGGDDDADG